MVKEETRVITKIDPKELHDGRMPHRTNVSDIIAVF
jgi:hypothetical protein